MSLVEKALALELNFTVSAYESIFAQLERLRVEMGYVWKKGKLVRR